MRRVVKTSHGNITTSTLSLRTAGMSSSTFGSRSKKRWRFRKMYVPPIRLMMRKNVAAIRKAGRTKGLISDSMILSIVALFSQASKIDISQNVKVLSPQKLGDRRARAYAQERGPHRDLVKL